MSLLLIINLSIILTLSSTATSHYSSSSSFPPSQSSSFPEWRSARATYYAAADPRDAVGGACGYGDLVKAGYGMATVGLSEVLFERGQICGACFELKCVDDLRWCIAGTSIIVTATNFCAPNYGFTPDGGGRCNAPNKHFVLPIEAFEKIAIWKAGNMPVLYRRYCLKLYSRIPSYLIIFFLEGRESSVPESHFLRVYFAFVFFCRLPALFFLCIMLTRAGRLH